MIGAKLEIVPGAVKFGSVCNKVIPSAAYTFTVKEVAPVLEAKVILEELVVMADIVGVGLVKLVPTDIAVKVNVDIELGSDVKKVTPSPIAVKLTL